MLSRIFFVLILIVVFSFQPFTFSDVVPSFVRVPVLFLLVMSFILLTFTKKITFYFLLGFSVMFVLLFPVWHANAPKSLSDIVYVLTLIMFVVSLFVFLKRMPGLVRLLAIFFLFFLLFVSVCSIISFLSFNLGLLPYSPAQIADYLYYYNPFLGYINVKIFDSGNVVGRVCHFMLEPSYLAWYLVTGFYLLPNYFAHDKLKLWAARVVVFLGAMGTASTSAFILFPLLFVLNFINTFFKTFRLSPFLRNSIIIAALVVIVLTIILLPRSLIIDTLGKSSLEDRENRIEASFVILASSGIKDIVLGHSPAYIGNYTEGKGESNQYIKILVEEGVIILGLSVFFIVYCTRKNFNFMLANLIFLNSVVIFWTPLFLINLLICKYYNKSIAAKEPLNTLPATTENTSGVLFA